MRASSYWAGLLALVIAASTARAADKNVRELFNGRTLEGWAVTDFGGQGEIEVKEGKIVARMGAVLTGIHFTNSIPTNRYEVSLEAMKIDGQFGASLGDK